MSIRSICVKLLAVAAFPAGLMAGAAFSSPSTSVPFDDMPASAWQEAEFDQAYRPGQFGVDYALITGPRGPGTDKATPAQPAKALPANSPPQPFPGD